MGRAWDNSANHLQRGAADARDCSRLVRSDNGCKTHSRASKAMYRSTIVNDRRESERQDASDVQTPSQNAVDDRLQSSIAARSLFNNGTDKATTEDSKRLNSDLAKSATKSSRWLSCGPRDPSQSLEGETPPPPNPE